MRAAGTQAAAASLRVDVAAPTGAGAVCNATGGFGYHPLGAWLDNTGEALACEPWPGNTGGNAGTDHLLVLQRALSRLPDR